MSEHPRNLHALRNLIDRASIVPGLCGVLLLLAANAIPARSQGVADSLARGLDSTSMAVRYDAVVAISSLAPSAIPAPVRARLISLLESEGVALKTVSFPTVETDTLSGELYPGYLTALTMEVVQFADVSSLRGLALSGLGVSRVIQNFVVANAALSLPFLDEAFASPHAEHSVLLTWGLMLAPAGGSLTASQQQRIRQEILAAVSQDTLGFVWAVRLGGLTDLEPVVRAIAATNPDPIVSARAAQVDTTLIAVRATQSNTTILTGAQAWLAAICLGASGSRNGVCQSLNNNEANAIKHLSQGNVNALKNVLSALIDRAQTALSNGDLTSFEASIVIDSAQRVLATL